MRIEDIFGYILFPIEYLVIIVYLILIIIIGFKNIKYNKFQSKEIIKERFLYEQITYEIYNSIESNILLDLKIQDICEDNYQPINFTIKLNNNSNYKYTTNISHLFNKQFCIPIYDNFKDIYNIYELKYEELLKHSVNLNSSENETNITNTINNTINNNNLDSICKLGYKPCGILDTMNNILCFPKKYNCPLNDLQISIKHDSFLLNNNYSEIELENDISLYLNNEENVDRPIIVTNLLSFDKPWDHEWEKLIAKNDKKIKRENFPFENYDIYMINSSFHNLSPISLTDIVKWEENNENLKLLLVEIEQPSEFYYLYHRNYIGFKNYKELKKFKKLFNSNDYKNNPLFKLSKTLRPYITSIVFGFIFLFIYISIFLFGVKVRFFYSDKYIIPFIFAGIVSFIYFIIYISLYFSDKAKFKKMDFQFDEQIQTAFNLYSKRVKQPIYTATIVLLFISIIPHISFLSLILGSFIYHVCIRPISRECGYCGLW